MTVQLPLPPFYNPKNAAVWCYNPDESVLIEAAHENARTHNVKPAGSDTCKVAVVPIDLNQDFTLPEGALYVAGRSGTGAIDDTRRTAEFIYREAPQITGIFPTFDTHFPHQIFFASFWEGPNGERLNDHSMIVEDVGGVLNNVALDGSVLIRNVRPKLSMARIVTGKSGATTWLYNYCLHYVRELKRTGKYTLYLWPPHCLLGKVGHSLSGVFQEARNYHAYLRGTDAPAEIKGGLFASENYSVFSPEVMVDHTGSAFAQRNTRFLEMVMGNDMVVLIGQAASHCVASSIDDLLDWLIQHDPELARRITILDDCMSAVTVPDGKGGFAADFTDQAQAALDRFRTAGMNIEKSTTPMEDWKVLPKNFK
jgi:nicotinamidase-related amidase